MTARDMTAYITIGRFADEETIVSVGTTRDEALDLADKFHIGKRGEWDTDAERLAWLDSLAMLELRGDANTLRRFVSMNGSETTFSPNVTRALNPYITSQER